MFTEYYVKGSFLITGKSALRKRFIHEVVCYRRTFLLEDDEDVITIAMEDMQKRANHIVDVIADKLKRFRYISVYYGSSGVLWREKDQWKLTTRNYSSPVSITLFPVEISNKRPLEEMTVEEVRKKLTINQWKRLMNE